MNTNKVVPMKKRGSHSFGAMETAQQKRASISAMNHRPSNLTRHRSFSGSGDNKPMNYPPPRKDQYCTESEEIRQAKWNQIVNEIREREEELALLSGNMRPSGNNRSEMWMVPNTFVVGRTMQVDEMDLSNNKRLSRSSDLETQEHDPEIRTGIPDMDRKLSDTSVVSNNSSLRYNRHNDNLYMTSTTVSELKKRLSTFLSMQSAANLKRDLLFESRMKRGGQSTMGEVVKPQNNSEMQEERDDDQNEYPLKDEPKITQKEEETNEVDSGITMTDLGTSTAPSTGTRNSPDRTFEVSKFEKVRREEGDSEFFNSEEEFHRRRAGFRWLDSRLLEELFVPNTYLFNPESILRRSWDLYFVFSAILYTAVRVPYAIGFDIDETNDPLNNTFFWINRLVDLIFVCDMCFIFSTALKGDQGFITDRKVVALKYLKSWFFLDFTSTIPFDVIFWASGLESYESLNRSAKLLKLHRTIRILRLLKIKRVIMSVQMALGINFSVMRIFKFLFSIVLLAHFLATGWLAVVVQNKTIVGRGEITIEAGQSRMHRYSTALYWSVQTMTTIGYGDFSNETTTERLFCCAALIIGAVTFTYGSTQIVHTITSMGSSQKIITGYVQSINDWSKDYHVPSALTSQLVKYYYYKNDRVYFGEENLVSSLSLPLQKRVKTLQFGEMINNIPLFSRCSRVFLVELMLLIRTEFYPMYSLIYEENTIGDSMYVVRSGHCALYRSNGHAIGTGVVRDAIVIGNGQAFGEISILEPTARRVCSVVALDWVDLILISREDLVRILPFFAYERRLIRRYAAKKLQAWASVKRRRSIKPLKSPLDELLDGQRIQRISARLDNELTRKHTIDQVNQEWLQSLENDDQSSKEHNEGNEHEEQEVSDLSAENKEGPKGAAANQEAKRRHVQKMAKISEFIGKIKQQISSIERDIRSQESAIHTDWDGSAFTEVKRHSIFDDMPGDSDDDCDTLENHGDHPDINDDNESMVSDIQRHLQQQQSQSKRNSEDSHAMMGQVHDLDAQQVFNLLDIGDFDKNASVFTVEPQGSSSVVITTQTRATESPPIANPSIP